MKKLALLGAAAALLVAAGTPGYAYACDKENKSASATVAKSEAKTQAVPAVASGSSSCAAKKSSAAVASGSCAAKNVTTLAGAGGQCGSKAVHASSDGHCGEKGTKSTNAKMAAECAEGECADLVFTVADMNGDCCTGKIEKALASVKGVHGVWVDSETKKAYVCASTAKKIDTKAALKNLKKAGFSNAKYVGVDTEKSGQEVKKAG